MTFVNLKDIRHSTRERRKPTAHNHLPPWFKVKIRQGSDYRDIRRIMTERGLHTICEEAKCPNIWECWNNRTATFLILGDICTRRCHYCDVTTGHPHELDYDEPIRVAEAVEALGLRPVSYTHLTLPTNREV